MTDAREAQALRDQRPLTLPDAIDADRVAVTKTLDPTTRKRLGQFMTPAPVAKFMASLFAHRDYSVRLLDAGAGMGTLVAAYVDAMCEAGSRPERVAHVTAVELDSRLASRLRANLAACEERCAMAGIALEHEVIEGDFLAYAADAATLNGMFNEQLLASYDAAILNPPYAKISMGSRDRRLLRYIGIESTNLYAAFVSVAIKMLRPGGELVAITPRSFCNGPYFRQFRHTLLSKMSLRQVHVYASRREAFRDDDVLQENVILHAVRGTPPPKTVRITCSNSSKHDDMTVRDVPYVDVVRPQDGESFIHIATSDEDINLADLIQRQPCTLASLGLSVSTGRVVDFRARTYLRDRPQPTTVPLIYASHFDAGFVKWPKEGRKPNALYAGAETNDLMVPSGTYVLTKRFTSKEERRRVVACIYDPNRMPQEFPVVGFENHLNYFHSNGKGISRSLARGLAVYLNSTAVDGYFRQFSGHTQVNATDLRNLRYPRTSTLEALGRAATSVVDQPAVDQAMSTVLG